MYAVRMLKSATRDLERLDKATGRRVVKRLNWLSENLENITPEELKGNLSGFYKIRERDYRIIYEILRNEKVIIIHHIGHRRDIYRKRQ